MHAPYGSCRKPAGARAPDGAGRAATGRATRGPRREWRRRGRRRTPTLAAALAHPRALGRRHGGARRSRDAAGRRAGRAETPPSPVACLVTSGRWDARPPARARAMATARPMAARRALRGRRRAEWVGNGTTGRGRKPRRGRALDAGPRERALLLPYGSARDRRDRPGGVPNAADWPIFAQKPFLLRKRSASCASNYSQKIGFCASPKRKLGGGPTTLLGGAFPFPVAPIGV